MDNNSIGFVGALQLILIVLKLLKVIDWSWFWVLTPIWGSLIVVFVVFAVIIILKIIQKV